MIFALIAHDDLKDEMVSFIKENEQILSKYTFYATGTTGKRLLEHTNLKIFPLLSGPYGGDQQIGALVAEKKINAVIFLRDPLTSQPHEPDVTALIRICDVHKVPIATNIGTAKIFIKNLGADYEYERDV